MGAAIDINAYSPNGYAQNAPSGWDPSGSRGGNFGCDLPLNIGEIAARHGLGWGGNWSRPWDPMHFSAASVERGAYVLNRQYKVAENSDVGNNKCEISIMIFDKRKGSLLNYIQLPLNVITPYGTYLGTGYKETGEPSYILSHVRLTTFPVVDLVFGPMSKNAIIDTDTTILEMTDDNKIGYGYQVTNTEIKWVYNSCITKNRYFI